MYKNKLKVPLSGNHDIWVSVDHYLALESLDGDLLESDKPMNTINVQRTLLDLSRIYLNGHIGALRSSRTEVFELLLYLVAIITPAHYQNLFWVIVVSKSIFFKLRFLTYTYRAISRARSRCRGKNMANGEKQNDNKNKTNRFFYQCWMANV